MKLFILSFLITISVIKNSESVCPNIISRAEWGARSPSGTITNLPASVNYAIIHHAETASCTLQASCVSLVKYLQNLHMDTNGWSDIGFSFLVGEDGNVYEGRGWTKTGAHTVNYNSDSIGIGIIGTFSGVSPNSLALNAAKDLIQCGIDRGTIKRGYSLLGHSDVSATDCPGLGLYNVIKTWDNFGGTTSTGGCPTIITRAQWGARSPSGTIGNLPSSVSFAVIHHRESSSCTTQAACINIVKSYQNYHMDSNGWSDIGYNFIVGEDGNVYEGRGWTKVGAHAPSYNSDSIGICVIGNFMANVPNSAAQNAVKSLIQCGVSLGRIKTTYQLKGHRDGSATDCPGDSFYNLIKTWTNFTG